jgi:tRNA A-37 threonylcarbamoyl transferase component Bud32
MPKKLISFLLLIFSAFLFLSGNSFAIEAGSLHITSRPSGATVYLDDTQIGNTDIMIHGIPIGSHKVRLELEGYEKVEQIISVKSGQTTRIPQVLARAGRRASVTGDIVVPPLQELFSEFINPWVVMLVLLLLAGLVVLTLIIRAIPAKKSAVPVISKAQNQRASRPVKAKVPSRPLKISFPAKGITLKKAATLGNYRVLEKIASGGMAKIYMASHAKNGGMAVLKVPYDQFQNDHRFVERFRREAELGKKLQHDNIIRIYEYGTSKKGLTYIAMEYLPGIDLRGYLDTHGKMPVKEAVRTVAQICRALDYAHTKGIIHRDIKPENIMLPDKKGKVVLMDFGVAHAAYLGTVGTRSTYLGTPYYMSPDQTSRRRVDGRSDIYSLGIVFFEMLTGLRPFDDDDPLKVLIKHREAPPPKPKSLNRKIPATLERIVLKMLAKRPTDRYKSAGALLAALKRYMGKEGIGVD